MLKWPRCAREKEREKERASERDFVFVVSYLLLVERERTGDGNG